MPLFGGIKEVYSAITKMGLRYMLFELENTILIKGNDYLMSNNLFKNRKYSR